MEYLGPTTSTGEILAELGRRLQHYRLQQNRTVEELAAAAGVSARTVRRAEAGENPTLESIVRILRALGRLDALDAFLPMPLVSPLQLAAMRGRQRQRASGSRKTSRNG